jgi:hypothetical protein
MMPTGDKIFATLGLLFLVGLAGGIFDSVQWLWLCAPFVLVVGVITLIFWLASKQLKGLKLW